MPEDAISIGGVDLAAPDTYRSGMPYDAFAELRRRAPVAWHPYGDGPGFLALTGYDEILAVSHAGQIHCRIGSFSLMARCATESC